MIGSRQAVLGQAWGGFSHSIGFALSENYEDMKKHATMRGAGVPRCNDVPDTFNVLFHETYRENGPHGSTGCAKGFQSAGHVSILNAIADAVGVRVATLPVTPEKLKAAMTAKAAGVPLVVAINKMDVHGANPDRIKQQLTEYGLVPEEWGGETIVCPISAKTGEGVEAWTYWLKKQVRDWTEE